MVADYSVSFKHALVTGPTGIVGTPLCRALGELGVRVTAFSREVSSSDVPNAVATVRGNILSAEDVLRAAAGADVIFHLAAAVHGSASSRSEFARVNIDGTANLIAAAQAVGAKLVHVSTVNVAGFKNRQLADAYAETKSEGEQLVKNAVEDGLDAVIVRPATVFGNEIGKAGLIVERLLNGSLRVLPAPSRKISPVWSSDLADALVAAGSIGTNGRTYTIAGETVSTREFVARVCDAAGLRRPVISIPGILLVLPLQFAWWTRKITRWTPPVSVKSLLNGSEHDGELARLELGFEYTTIEEIFG